MARVKKDFGAYTLEELRGGGGMGKVYRATQKALGKTVAIKLLRSVDADDETAVTRFRREALLGAGLNHEHLVQVLDFGLHDGEYFIAMEYVDGSDLRQWLSKYGPVPIEIAVLLMRDISRGIEHAHQRDLVHRDIKPGNIMFRRDGVVKITDFGLARQTGTSSIGVTLPGSVIGAPAYMSPEQANGEELDQRSDIFSAGVVGYELFGGVRPFPGDTYSAVRHNILTLEPRSLDDLSPLVPDEAVDIIAQMLKKDRAKRCRSMEHVRSVLEMVAEQMGLLRGDKDLLREYVQQPEEMTHGLRKKRQSYHMTQGIAYEKTGHEKYEDALLEFRRVVHLDPSNREAQKHIEMLKAELDVQRTRPFEPPKPPLSLSPSSSPPPPLPRPRPRPPDQVTQRKLIAACGGLVVLLAALFTYLWWVNRPATLRITARPVKSLVFVDETQLPALPTVERKIKKGDHRIRVEKAGYRPYDQVLTLRPGELRPLTIKLETLLGQPGRLRLVTIPPGARVYVDNQSQSAVTNFSIPDIPPGAHSIRVELDGYQPADRQVTVEPGESATVTFALVRISDAPVRIAEGGTLSISSRPAGAEIFLDGGARAYSRKTNAVLKDVKPGIHVIRLVKSGYAPNERTVSVSAGEEARVNAELRVAPGTMGTLDIEALPFAQYFVDGALRDANKGRVKLEVEAGRPHSVRIVHPVCGSKQWSSVRLEPGQVLQLKYNFQKDRGSIAVGHQGAWGYVELDGVRTDRTTPATLECISVGSHKVNLVREGFVVEGGVRSITVRTGERIQMSFKLIPK
jgi:serine/threonine protein kinase